MSVLHTYTHTHVKVGEVLLVVLLEDMGQGHTPQQPPAVVCPKPQPSPEEIQVRVRVKG